MPNAAGIVANLTPATVVSDNYNIAQAPAQGMEKKVYLTLRPSTLLGIASMTATGTLSWEYLNSQRYQSGTATIGITSGAKTVTISAGTSLFTDTFVKTGDIVKITLSGGTFKYGQVDTVDSTTQLTCFTNFDATDAACTAISVYSGDPICCFVLTECRAVAAPVATFGDIAGTFTPAGYATDLTYNFGTTRGVELVSATEVNSPLVSGVTPTITNAENGCKFGFIQLPRLTDFKLIGATRSSDITAPSASSKAIPRGMWSSFWSKRGMSAAGRMRITAMDLVEDDGIARYRGAKCTAMVVTEKEETVTVSRQICTSFTLGQEGRNPEGDEISELSAEGEFQWMVTLVAP